MIPLLYMYSDTYAMLVLRVVTGIIMIVHGWMKVKNMSGTKTFFNNAGFKPAGLLAPLVTYVEFLGGILLVLGLFTQYVSLVYLVQFAVILIWKIRMKQKFTGAIEFDLLLFAAVIVLLTIGGGTLSLDHALFTGF